MPKLKVACNNKAYNIFALPAVEREFAGIGTTKLEIIINLKMNGQLPQSTERPKYYIIPIDYCKIYNFIL